MGVLEDILQELKSLKKQQQDIIDSHAKILLNQESLKEQVAILINENEKQYSVIQLMQKFGKTRKVIYAWQKKGLQYHYVGKHRYVNSSSLHTFISQSNRLKEKYSKILQAA